MAWLFIWPWLFEVAVTEVDAALRWMPRQSKLKSGTCITKRNTSYQGLHCCNCGPPHTGMPDCAFEIQSHISNRLLAVFT